MVQQNEYAKLPYFSPDVSLYEANIEAGSQSALKLVNDAYAGDIFLAVANNQLSLINFIDGTNKSPLAQNPDINFLKELWQYLLREIVGFDLLNKIFSIQTNKTADNPAREFLEAGTDESTYSNPQEYKAKDFIDQIVQAISKNEGNFTAINFNDAGYGISLGIRQWNQKAGELPLLLKSWYKSDPEKFERIFGEDYASKLLTERWVRSYNMSGDFNLMERMKIALADKSYQKVQLDLACAFVRNGIKLACDYGFCSKLGIALVCDMVNQMGYSCVTNALQKAGLCRGAVINNERKVIENLSRIALRPQEASRYLTLVRMFC